LFYFSAVKLSIVQVFYVKNSVHILKKFLSRADFFSAEVYVRAVHLPTIKHLQGFQEILTKISNDILFNNMSLRFKSAICPEAE
jgi:hypothetical protein